MMEMLVDPVLVQWVPEWVVEQYKRWNPKFAAALKRVLQDDAQGVLSNRQVLRRVKREVVRQLRLAADKREAEKRGPGQGDDEGSASLSSEEGGGGASSSDADEEAAHDSMAREAMIRDEMPVLGGGDEPGGGDEGGRAQQHEARPGLAGVEATAARRIEGCAAPQP